MQHGVFSTPTFYREKVYPDLAIEERKKKKQSRVRLNFKVFNDVGNRAKANRVIKGG